MKKFFLRILSLILVPYVYAMPSKPPSLPADPKPPAQGLKMKSLFPKQEWTDAALKAVEGSKLATFHPSDEKSFCPKGMSPRNWVHLLAAMAKFESGFDPNQEYKEGFTNNGKPIISTGLLQISLASGNGYGCAFASTAAIKDPKKNLECGVKILSRWVPADGVISNASNKGGARYWSVLRPTGKIASVKATMKAWCE